MNSSTDVRDGVVTRTFAERICESCGEAYVPTGTRQKVCGKNKCTQERDCRADVRRSTEGPVRISPVILKCEECGEDFNGSTRLQKVCFNTECKRSRLRKNKARYLAKPGTRERNIASERKRRESPDARRRISFSRRMRAYGVNEETFNEILSKQGGGCKICGITPESGVRLCVDHDHACCPSGSSCGLCIRGVLCFNCNLAEGFIRSAAELTDRTVEEILIQMLVFVGQWNNRPTDAAPRVPVPPVEIIFTDHRSG